MITPEIIAALNYISAYNVAIVESATYPDQDICRVAQQGDPRHERGVPLVARAARDTTNPVRSLHEAARRGSADDVRRFIAGASLNAEDGTGMTPLAWAAARNNKAAFAILLEHGADPWAGVARGDYSAAYWAAATGHVSIFDQLRRLGRPIALKPWPESYMSAAVSSGSVPIVKSMIADGYASIQASTFFLRGLPKDDAIAPLLKKHNRGLADALLFLTLTPWDEDAIPLSLMRLALKHGANPNATRNYGETALGLASRGIWNGSLEAVQLLLKAGADVNLPSAEIPVAPSRPFWNAVNTALLPGIDDVTTGRAWAVARRLAAAGANLNLTDKDGKPTIWSLLTQVRWDPEQINESPALVVLLPMLVELGMNPNAVWQEKTVLPLVERKLGTDSALAKALRASGAK